MQEESYSNCNLNQVQKKFVESYLAQKKCSQPVASRLHYQQQENREYGTRNKRACGQYSK